MRRTIIKGARFLLGETIEDMAKILNLKTEQLVSYSTEKEFFL